jgi:hypothetical protein
MKEEKEVGSLVTRSERDLVSTPATWRLPMGAEEEEGDEEEEEQSFILWCLTSFSTTEAISRRGKGGRWEEGRGEMG